MTLLAVMAMAPLAAAVPVEESVGITRDGTQRSSQASRAPGSTGGVTGPSPTAPTYGGAVPGPVAQGNPWHAGAGASDDAGGGVAGAAGGPPAPMIAALGTTTTQRVSSAPAGPASQTSELFYQIQLLQQEVQDLRGLVEELTHQVNRLASDQQAQYRDLDGRVVALRGGAGTSAPVAAGSPVDRSGVGAPAPSAGAATPQTGAAAPQAGAEPAPGATAAPGEREAYSAAFELMRQRQFAESTAAFNRFVASYPNSAFTSNAFYWLGELHLAQDDLERARQSFTQVLNLYPDSQKVPDALYKLGVVQHRLGDVGRAREFLNRAVSQYPGSSAAALAQTYLSELQ